MRVRASLGRRTSQFPAHKEDGSCLWHERRVLLDFGIRGLGVEGVSHAFGRFSSFPV